MAVEFVADGRVLVERELERLLPVGYLQPLLVAVGFETPENIFVVEIDPGMAQITGYLRFHVASGAGKEGDAPQRQPAVAYPVVELAVVRSPRHPVESPFQAIEEAIVESAVFGFGYPGSPYIVVAAGTPVVEVVGEDPGIGLIDEHVFPLLESLVELGRHHESVVGGDAQETGIGEVDDVVGPIAVGEGCQIERLGFHETYIVCGEHPETLV